MKFPQTLLLLLLPITLISCSSNLREDLVGEWQVSAMEVDMKDVPQPLIDNAEILSLATSYEFKANGHYCMTVSKNSLENGRKHQGRMTLDPKSGELTLHTDTLVIETQTGWEIVKRNEFNGPMFSSIKMKVEHSFINRLELSQTERAGTLFYTLDRIQ